MQIAGMRLIFDQPRSRVFGLASAWIISPSHACNTLRSCDPDPIPPPLVHRGDSIYNGLGFCLEELPPSNGSG